MAATVYEDTRQQAGKHDAKHEWFAAHGVELVRRKLDFGDYARDGSNVYIDTKRDVRELAGNLGRDHARFVREAERARSSGCLLVVLVERAGAVADVPGLAMWTNPLCARCSYRKMGACDHTQRCKRYRNRPIQGATLARIAAAVSANHGCRFEFVRGGNGAPRICELLGLEVNLVGGAIGAGEGG